MKAIQETLEEILQEKDVVWSAEDKAMAAKVAADLQSLYSRKLAGTQWLDDEIKVAETFARNIAASSDVPGWQVVQELVMRTIKERSTGLAPS